MNIDDHVYTWCFEWICTLVIITSKVSLRVCVLSACKLHVDFYGSIRHDKDKDLNAILRRIVFFGFKTRNEGISRKLSAYIGC